MSDPLKPSVSLLVMLGSLAVHVQEYLGTDGYSFDRSAMEALLDTREVKEWLHAMDAEALLPVKR